MVSGDNVTVTLTGGAPWGFRMTGGGSLPLEIAKIRKKSQAHEKGLKEGDAVVSINGTHTHDRTHDQAIELIENAGDTLTLQIYRGDADDLGQLLASSKRQAPLLIPAAEGEGGGGGVISSSTSTSVQDDGQTRREVQQDFFVTGDAGHRTTTFVKKEHTTTTTTSSDDVGGIIFVSDIEDVNGNTGGGGGGRGGGGGLGSLTATVEVSAETVPLHQRLSPGPALSPKPALSPQPVATAQLAPSPVQFTMNLSPGQGGASSPQLAPSPVNFTAALASKQSSASPQPVNFSPAVSPKPALSPKPFAPSPKPFAPSPQPVQFSPQPAFQPQYEPPPQPPPLIRPKPSGPTFAPRPTFKAVPPKVAPMVAPKPSMGPPVPPKPQFKKSAKPTFNAKAVSTPAPFAPGNFQVSATAMYSQQPYSPGGPPQQQQQQQKSISRSQSYSSKQMFSQGGNQPYSPVNPQPQQFSPMSISSPLSPQSQPFSAQPFSPLSPNSGAPMFNVRNNMGQGKNVWEANMWLPGQEPAPQKQQTSRQQDAYNNNENIEVPKRMTVKERQQMLLSHTARTHHSLSARSADPDFDAPPEEVQRAMQERAHHHRLHVFGPPVASHGPSGDLGLVRMDSEESGQSSPTSSLYSRRRKMYADSAFYEDPSKNYPTIEEQMKLCRLISHSLTSAANRRARGAKMFAKRKKRSTKWVHEGHSEWGSSSAGDVANLDELDSELDPSEGGNKQLFAFRIPNLSQRVGAPDKNTKMSLKKDEFERLRLQSQKCDHRTVSPGTCFDIVADLKASKGRGGRLFERRKNRADKFIIDESNAKVAPKARLDSLLGSAPLKSSKSPWEAAQSHNDGSVDAAFDHLTEKQRMDKLNQMLKYQPPSKPAPAAPLPDVLSQPLPVPLGPRTDLKNYSATHLLQGRNFNRAARGWCSSGASEGDTATHLQRQSEASQPRYQQQQQQQHSQLHPHAPAQASGARPHYSDYNPRPKAWQGGGGAAAAPGESYSCPASMSASWNSGDFDSYYQHSDGYGGGGGMMYSADELPACDL